MSKDPEARQDVRVLVVEDEALIAEEIRERLIRLGYLVVGVVDTGADALRLAEEQRPDLIIMDIRLKGSLDGVQAAEEIRRRLDVPVVFLTAHSDDATIARAKLAGPFGYVLKPFRERDLLAAAEVALHRHELERLLRESEQRYAATLGSIGDGVIATDPEGRVTFMNQVAEALTDWRLDDALGLPVDRVLTLLSERHRAPLANPALEAIRQRRPVSFGEPTLLLTRAGTAIPIGDSAAPVVDRDGRLLGAVVAFRDERERRLAEVTLRTTEEQLRHAQKMEAVGRLAGGVAHDFNNLLTVINGLGELLLDGHGLNDAGRELVTQIRRAGERAASLTRQLLAFSRRQVLLPTVVQLGSLVSELSRLLVRVIGEDVALTTRSSPGLWPIRADPGQLEQVVMNLAVNSRDAMPGGGRLTIETSNVELDEAAVRDHPEMPPGRYVLLSVADNGVGMDESTQEHAFEPFFTTKGMVGSGLGLATVYGIVKQSGGFIHFDSAPGRGTTFRIHFPALEGEVPTTRAAEPPRVASPGNEVVLLVEDDEEVRSLAAAALRRQGYVVHVAGDGAEGLRLFREHESIRLIVTDVVLPGVGGRELGESAKALKESVRVLYLSGYAPELAAPDRLPAELTFLPKPFTLTELARKVREVLDS